MNAAWTDPLGNERLDRVGTWASGLCAAHCAFCAFSPAAFGALGLGLLLGHEAEWVFTLVAVVVAAGALALGWRRHRSVPVAVLLVLGIAGLLASRGLEMGSAHLEHRGERHATLERGASPTASAALEPDDHRAEPTEDLEAPEVAHEGVTHRAGTAVGILAGLLLLFGHILNSRTSGQGQKACCE